ncbi:hypothetical protein TrRE_jg793, partial [Triparma retinervis]
MEKFSADDEEAVVVADMYLGSAGEGGAGEGGVMVEFTSVKYDSVDLDKGWISGTFKVAQSFNPYGNKGVLRVLEGASFIGNLTVVDGRVTGVQVEGEISAIEVDGAVDVSGGVTIKGEGGGGGRGGFCPMFEGITKTSIAEVIQGVIGEGEDVAEVMGRFGLDGSVALVGIS